MLTCTQPGPDSKPTCTNDENLSLDYDGYMYCDVAGQVALPATCENLCRAIVAERHMSYQIHLKFLVFSRYSPTRPACFWQAEFDLFGILVVNSIFPYNSDVIRVRIICYLMMIDTACLRIHLEQE